MSVVGSSATGPSRESNRSRVTERDDSPYSLSSSPRRPPHLTQRMPGIETTFQRSRLADAFSADSEAKRHSVAVKEAVRVGRIHRGAMG